MRVSRFYISRILEEVCTLFAGISKDVSAGNRKAASQKQMADFIEKIQNEISDDVQILSLSRPSAYGEYEPYTFVHSYQEFESRAKQL